jgi:hypothetical protein
MSLLPSLPLEMMGTVDLGKSPIPVLVPTPAPVSLGAPPLSASNSPLPPDYSWINSTTPIFAYSTGGGGGGGGSNFDVLTCSTINVSSIVNVSSISANGSIVADGKVQGSNVVGNKGVFALAQTGTMYFSSLTGQLAGNASTFICNFTNQGIYAVNLGMTTSAVNGFPMSGIVTIGNNDQTTGYNYGQFTPLTTSAIYNMNLYVPPNASAPAELYVDNNNIGTPTYIGAITRLGF